MSQDNKNKLYIGSSVYGSSRNYESNFKDAMVIEVNNTTKHSFGYYGDLSPSKLYLNMKMNKDDKFVIVENVPMQTVIEMLHVYRTVPSRCRLQCDEKLSTIPQLDLFPGEKGINFKTLVKLYRSSPVDFEREFRKEQEHFTSSSNFDVIAYQNYVSRIVSEIDRSPFLLEDEFDRRNIVACNKVNWDNVIETIPGLKLPQKYTVDPVYRRFRLFSFGIDEENMVPDTSVRLNHLEFRKTFGKIYRSAIKNHPSFKDILNILRNRDVILIGKRGPDISLLDYYVKKFGWKGDEIMNHGIMEVNQKLLDNLVSDPMTSVDHCMFLAKELLDQY